jgi:lipid II:glycine glycyltransferase (peptidoglycan interpeptide bridge formation enzyme)
MLASYAPKLRSQIKKAEKNGLTVELSTTPRLIDAFYSVYSANMHRLGSPPHSLDWFKAVACSYAAAESLLLCVVKHQEQVVGAGFVLRVGNRAVIPWASTLAEFNHLAPNMLLYWSIQSWLADHHIQYFDFGRSTYGEGTYRFKKQWGAQPIALDWLQYGADCQPIVEHKAASQSRIRPLLESIWRSMPEPLMTRLGSKLRRYITL